MNRRKFLGALLALPAVGLAAAEVFENPMAGWRIVEEIDEPPFYGTGVMEMMSDIEAQYTRDFRASLQRTIDDINRLVFEGPTTTDGLARLVRDA